MDELLKNKKRILLYLTLLILLCVGSIILTIGAAPIFKGNGYSIGLLLIFLVQVPLIISVSIIGIRTVNLYIENDEKTRASSIDEIEKLEKEVEEKAKEAEDLSFNLKRLGEDLGEYNNWEDFGSALLSGISKQIDIVIGLVYAFNSNDKKYVPVADYAYFSDHKPIDFVQGDGITGQVVKDKKAMFINEMPEGYVKVISGLGVHKPKYLAIIPIVDKNDVIGVFELATFKPIEKGLSRKIDEIASFIGEKASTLELK